MKHVDVQHVALDPLAAVEQSSQGSQLAIDCHTDCAFDRMRRAHLVGHRTDPADARRDVGRLQVVAPLQERFEKPGRLVDLESDVRDLPGADVDVHRALALDARERLDADLPCLLNRHGLRFPFGTPRLPRCRSGTPA